MTAAAKPHARRAPSEDEVRAWLCALIEHPGFGASPRRKRLMTYLVEQTLQGRAERLKAFDIAVAVLGRDERFDPQQNPIVRLDVSRLRRDLEYYYLTAGADDLVRFDIPKGGYAPTFTAAIAAPVPTEASAELAPAPGPLRARHAASALIVLLMALAAASAFAFFRPPAPPAETGNVAQELGPSILVASFQGLDGGEASKLLATGITGQLVADLMRVETLRVYTGIAPASAAPASAAPAVAFRVEGTVQRDAAHFRVAARLVDAATGEVLWSETFDRAADVAGVLAVQGELATGLAERLALPNGAIAVATERPTGGRPTTMFAYDCVQRAWLVRRKSDGVSRSEALACLQDALVLEPGYANAWAAKSFLHVDGARLGLVPPEQVAGELAAGREAAERAFALAPDNIVSLQALANVRYNDGSFAEAERLQREAIALSPRNPESLAQLGWRLWARGRLDEGAALLREAIDRSWRSPTWYHQTLALALFLRGDLQLAYDEAVLGQGFCCGLGDATLAITAAGLGRTEEARAALNRALAQAPSLGRDPRGFWREFHVEEGLIDRLLAGLRQAGLAATPAEESNSRM